MPVTVTITFLHVRSSERRTLTVEVPHWSRAEDEARARGPFVPWEWAVYSIVEGPR